MTVDGAVSRVVVVGASGDIGTSVLETLSADPRGGSVLAVCRRPPELDLPKVTWAGADIEPVGAGQRP